ncbi:MAG: hypothetical protein NTX03_08860, partial [Bacteroidetes bacterium]|nr:hypothetical protein [Bacteroidota bacterium]
MKNILLFAAVLLLSLNSFAQKKWAATGNYYFNGAVLAVCDDPAGNIYFSGTAKNTSSKYYVAKYDGTTVTEIGNSSLNISNYALTMCSDKKGNIYMAGYFMD